jgi:hypothetical protein
MCPSSEETTVFMHTVGRKGNKHNNKNCAPSWLYLQDYTGKHGEQNLKIS